MSDKYHFWYSETDNQKRCRYGAPDCKALIDNGSSSPVVRVYTAKHELYVWPEGYRTSDDAFYLGRGVVQDEYTREAHDFGSKLEQQESELEQVSEGMA